MRQLRNEIVRHGGEFIATGDLIRDAVGGKWDNPSGAYNVALKERLVELSDADNWKEARKEWKATGNLWYIPFADEAVEVLPEYHQGHPHYCVCGHRIAWHFEIENTENNTLEIVGSEHIGFWMVVRHLIENEGIPEDMITEERVKKWIKESVKSMKKQWWWRTFGEQFEEWFTAVREADIILNSRKGSGYYDNDTNRYEYQRLVRKKAEGGPTNDWYKMASIVWRWNHPDNASAQINKRGYPNDRLWQDLMIFFFNLDAHKATIAEMDAERKARITKVAKDKKEEQERQAKEREERQAREEIRRKQRIAEQAKQQKLKDTAFERTCGSWGIEEFDAEVGRNDWEISFLTEMIKRINAMKFISDKQQARIIKIVNREEEEATEKQLAYIRKLGGNPHVDNEGEPRNLTKTQASKVIQQLKDKRIDDAAVVAEVKVPLMEEIVLKTNLEEEE